VTQSIIIQKFKKLLNLNQHNFFISNCSSNFYSTYNTNDLSLIHFSEYSKNVLLLKTLSILFQYISHNAVSVLTPYRNNIRIKYNNNIEKKISYKDHPPPYSLTTNNAYYYVQIALIFAVLSRFKQFNISGVCNTYLLIL